MSARAEEDPVEAEVELEFVDATLLIDVELKDAVIEAIFGKKDINIQGKTKRGRQRGERNF